MYTSGGNFIELHFFFCGVTSDVISLQSKIVTCPRVIRLPIFLYTWKIVTVLKRCFHRLYIYIRCKIPECDGPNPAEHIYEPEWLRFTIPYRDDTHTPRKCQRYALLSASKNGTKCVSSEFDVNTMEWCDNGWVFEDQENTIGTEVCVF